MPSGEITADYKRGACMRGSILSLFVIAGCAAVAEYTPREGAAHEEAASCGAVASGDEARLASPAAIATVEPFNVLLSS
jgi:hypothetical protein